MRKLSGILAVLLVVGMLLAGCQPTDNTGTTTTTLGGNNMTTTTDDGVTTTSGWDTVTTTAAEGATTTVGGNITTKPVQTTTTTQKSVITNAMPGSVKIWTESALTDVFATTAMPADADAAGAIHMLKNEAESIQLAIRPEEKDLTGLSITIEPVDGLTITAYQIGSIPYSKFSNKIGAYRRADVGVPVPEYYLHPNETWKTVKKGTTVSFCVEAISTAKTKAGAYKTNMIIRSNEGVRTVPLTVRVYNGTLSEPEDSDLDYVCWFENTVITYSYGIDMYSDEHLEVAKNIAQIMKKERQNVLYLELRELLIPCITVKSDGSYQFDFTNFDKLVETFLEYGSFKYICGSHLAVRDFYISPNNPNWPTNSMDVWTLVNQNGKTAIEWQYADSDKGVRHLRDMLSALYAHLKEKGWDKMWLQHVADEVDTPHLRQQVSTIYSMVQELMPTCQTVDAGFKDVVDYGSVLDIPAVRLDAYHEVMSACETHQAAGGTLWIYTCNGPQGNAMSRLNDFPLISTRALGWYMWQHRVDGYLHWAWNYWPGGIYSDIYCPDPYAVGDAFLVYPDGSNLSVKEGTRATAMRDALEDNELMRSAAKKNEARVQSIVDSLINNYVDFERDPDKYLEARIQLLEMLG